MLAWHRLFGLTMTDYFTGSAYRIELEKDLSSKQQLLDVYLMTYKSLRQPLDAWALDELVGHYVNYRKQSSPSLEELLPVEDFRLYAVSTRHPGKRSIRCVPLSLATS